MQGPCNSCLSHSSAVYLTKRMSAPDPLSPTQTEFSAKEAAEFLGVHLATVYEKKHLLGGRKKSARGQWVFDPRKCQAVRDGSLDLEKPDKPTTALPRATPDGTLAAAVFDALKRDMPPVDIVVMLEAPPDLVQRFTRDYFRMRGALVLDSEQLAALYRLPVVGVMPCETSHELMKLLSDSLTGELCQTCRRRPRVLCQVCRTAREAR